MLKLPFEPGMPVILADGVFPKAAIPVMCIKKTSHLVCCDGAAEKALNHGYEPDVVIGDLDSLSPALKEQLGDKLIHIPDQETNDLTKAVNFCVHKGYESVIVLGATGAREDHTLGNMGLVAEHSKNLNLIMVTDYGYMYCIRGKSVVASFRGQQVSLFAMNAEMPITSKGLKYPLNNMKLPKWWNGTLNECTNDYFELDIPDNELLLVYLVF